MTSRKTALRAAQAALDSKAEDLIILDLRRLSSTFDYFVICSATSERRSQAIADAVQEGLRADGARLWHQEGYREGGWVLLDFGSVVAHIFTTELRGFYQLERLWGDAPRLSLGAALSASKGAPRLRGPSSLKALQPAR